MKAIYLAALTLLSFVFLAEAQPPEEWRYNITCSMLDGRPLGDNDDEIILTESVDTCIGPDEVQFEINFNIGTARWKAARLQRIGEIDFIKQILEVNCRRCSHQVRFLKKDIVDYGLLVLWKDPLLDPPIRRENAFYLITDAISCFQGGMKYTFDWIYDGAPIATDLEKKMDVF